MKIKKMIVYRQKPSWGYLKEVNHLLRDDLTVLPCSNLGGTLIKGGYEDIAVTKGTNIPEEIYFNGKKEGIDCECCGDRWCKSDGVTEVDVYIFKTKDEFKQAMENKIIPKYSSYAVLEEIKEQKIKEVTMKKFNIEQLKEIKKLMSDITCLTLDVSQESKNTCILSLFGQISLFELEVYENGWLQSISRQDPPTKSYKCHYDGTDTFEGVIETLKQAKLYLKTLNIEN